MATQRVRCRGLVGPAGPRPGARAAAASPPLSRRQGHRPLRPAARPPPGPDTPAPPRFLPDYDNVFLGHADRARIVDEALRLRHRSGLDLRTCPLLLDGFIAGTWRIDRRRSATTLTITPFTRLARKEATALADEGLRLLEFAAPQDAHHVRVVVS